MANVRTGPAQYLARFGGQTIAGTQYALSKLGVDRSYCSIKIEEYIILCVPFQLGFKRSIFLASLSRQELAFFQKYVNTVAVLSIALNPEKRSAPVKFFVRCTISTLGQMKGRENAGIFVVDYKTPPPDQMVSMLGNFLETQERIRTQYDDYGNTLVRMTAETAKLMGFNMYATITEAGNAPKRIQVFSLNTKSMEHMEAAGTPVRKPGTAVSYQLFFKKYRISLGASISGAGTLPQGIVRTVSALEFSPELVEILDDYWYSSHANRPQKTAR